MRGESTLRDDCQLLELPVACSDGSVVDQDTTPLQYKHGRWREGIVDFVEGFVPLPETNPPVRSIHRHH
jgi:hypothetical protein